MISNAIAGNSGMKIQKGKTIEKSMKTAIAAPAAMIFREPLILIGYAAQDWFLFAL